MKKILCGILLTVLMPMAGHIYAAEEDWMPPGSKISTLESPEEWTFSPMLEKDALLGRLLFHSPSLLGEKAVRMGLTCASCHPAGHKNDQFFIPGLSDEPGTIDLTSDFWYEGGDDHKFNPKLIPSLRISRFKNNFGTGPHFRTLDDFSRHVIVTEFGGPEPNVKILKLLAAYMSELSNPAQPSTTKVPPQIPFHHYVGLFEDLPQERHLIASMLLEETGRRYKQIKNPAFIEIARELKKLREGNLPEAQINASINSLRKLSKRIL
ncbi:hypothetical protein GUA87_02005 [Sneathiella sp. P13V-1]|uniref:hypothetical protein n=1 Tax=Sneathiella sp. P13V-1 TaxID=2697366 RepID=UPI00187B4ED4|nr:hypothetical protein [Sneathiella sp. P13V-1]MBE7635602.1 hypothetical protein [Sneathiella sp. P13V-1]